jgi:hypothetical protein
MPHTHRPGDCHPTPCYNHSFLRRQHQATNTTLFCCRSLPFPSHTRRYILFSDSPSAKLLLSTACSTLTGLVIATPARPAKAQHHAAALAHITSLQNLFLISQASATFTTHCAAISRLTQLQQLVLFSMDDAPLLQQHVDLLPPSLQAFHTAIGCTARSPGLSFTHLTQLRQLSLPWIEPGLQLPQCTTQLEALGCQDVAPILQQKHLRSLRLWLCSFVPEQLQQLGTMPHILELHLGSLFDSHEVIDLTPHVKLPQLRTLEVIDGVFSPAAADALGKLTHVTSLGLLCRQLNAPAKQLLPKLQQLPRLQQLSMLLPQACGPGAGLCAGAEVLSGLCSTNSTLQYTGCHYLTTLSGLLRLQQGGPPVLTECDRKLQVHCFGSTPGSSLLGVLARSTWHTFLGKAPRPTETDAAAAAIEEDEDGGEEEEQG